jgi:hypothetical protein
MWFVYEWIKGLLTNQQARTETLPIPDTFSVCVIKYQACWGEQDTNEGDDK